MVKTPAVESTYSSIYLSLPLALLREVGDANTTASIIAHGGAI
jgi:hypothetical protein